MYKGQLTARGAARKRKHTRRCVERCHSESTSYLATRRTATRRRAISVVDCAWCLHIGGKETAKLLQCNRPFCVRCTWRHCTECLQRSKSSHAVSYSDNAQHQNLLACSLMRGQGYVQTCMLALRQNQVDCCVTHCSWVSRLFAGKFQRRAGEQGLFCLA